MRGQKHSEPLANKRLQTDDADRSLLKKALGYLKDAIVEHLYTVQIVFQVPVNYENWGVFS